MRTLTEKYRPKSLDDVVAQPKAVGALRAILARFGTFGGRAYWVVGPSGTGKTTISKIIAESIPHADRHEFAADSFGADEMTELELAVDRVCKGLPGFGLVVTINEAHGLRAPIIRRMLVLLERLQECERTNVAVIFTTTRDGSEQLFEDSIEEGPFLDRCTTVALTSQGAAKPFAELARKIAAAEGIDVSGLNLDRIAYDRKCSMRGILRALEACPVAA